MAIDDPPTCALCGDEYWLREGAEPSKYCDPCAHSRIEQLEPMLKKIRDFLELGPYYGEEVTNMVIETDKVLNIPD